MKRLPIAFAFVLLTLPMSGLAADVASDRSGITTLRSDLSFTSWKADLNLREYAELKKIATAHKESLFDLLNSTYFEALEEALEAHPGASGVTMQALATETDPILVRKLRELLKSEAMKS